ncbi:Ankyrin repeat and death domain-containing protein 1A [Frankliniella fusca]|uniref:Ankyrin repeat and death domain-containing protein 1A n=1 Tax=Frankliniella fusca TaxID=407009 RepID=A0AAE1HPB9_9NEOP|nr:Ankyrin repeat and death domain-containing protein 1A [Frankliniella fusca]
MTNVFPFPLFQKELTLLMCGARNSRLSVVNLILESLEEPNLEVVDAEQQTALYHAAMGGHGPILDVLIRAGADANTRNKRDANMMIMIVKSLIFSSVGAKLGRTPLHVSAEKGHVEAVRVLLQHGADAAVADQDGNAPLHVATENQQSTIVQELLSHGVDPDAENKRGLTALHVASGLGCRGIIESLVQSGAQLNKQTKDGSSPLHMACLQNQLVALELLIAKGADINALDVRLQSPMHIAAERGFTDACKMLLAAGAVIDQKEQTGKTPLYMAARGSFTAIVDMIIKTARLDCPASVSIWTWTVPGRGRRAGQSSQTGGSGHPAGRVRNRPKNILLDDR